MLSRRLGPLLVAVAALLWATDALFRVPTVAELSPRFIVFAEHGIALAVLLPLMLLLQRNKLLKLTPIQWLGAIIIGAAGSGIATVLFTMSFRWANPSVVILLQKLQPILVIVLAYLFLGEKPAKGFFLWALLAIGSALLLSFPELDFHAIFLGARLRSFGVLSALSAAGIWAVCTVIGKAILRTVPANVLTFWRYVFGFLVLIPMIGPPSDEPYYWHLVQNPTTYHSLLYMGLIPGLLAMLCYYQGMKRTPATITTFMELLFPVSAVALNTLFLHAPLTTRQVAAACVLLYSVTKISFSRT
jgi:drug/metabolite transporter (DMT)-like permease